MEPNLQFFAPLVGSVFTVATQAGPVALQLDSCTELPRHGLPPQFRTPLSLVFHGPAEPLLAQDNFYVEHAAMPRQAWCIAPRSPAAPGTPRYQVLFA